MEKNKERRTNLNLKGFPSFGTYCSIYENKTYFVPLIPNKNQFNNIKSCHLTIDSLYHKKEIFYILLNSQDAEGEGSIKIELKLKHLQKIETHTNELSNGKIEKTFYFYLNNPPRFFRKVREKIKIESNYVLKFNECLDSFNYNNHYHSIYEKIDKKGRITKITEKIYVDHKTNSTSTEKNNHNEKNEDEFEDNLSFEIDEKNEFSSYIRADSYISKTVEFTNFYLLNLILKFKIIFYNIDEENDFMDALKIRNISEEKREIFTLTEDLKIKLDTDLRRKTKTFYSNFLNLHFNLQYSILCLITQKRLNIFSFNVDLIKDLKKFDCESQNKASIIIETIIKEHSKINSNSDIKEIFEYYYKQSFNVELITENDKDKQNINNMKTRTIEVTPSIIYYKPPVYEKMNHILRKYSEYKDNFIKVNFVDEETNKIFYSTQSMWILMHFLKKIMLKCITVGSRAFEFLSASNSQMKNSSFWFICLEGTRFIEVEQIIRELGDFSKETNIHKNAARRGQCLSTTNFIKNLNPNNIRKIKDIERNNYLFTDGIGMISIDLAFECSKAFKLDYASAFQIRIGGIKGMVAVNPDIGEKEVILVRPSMIKFDSLDTELGVIRCSTFSQGYLNRQIIILLSTLGVHNDIFLNMLKNDLKIYQDLINSPDIVLSGKYDGLNEITRKCYFFFPTLSNFVKHNINIRDEPFLSSLVLNISICKILDLKNKGKILDVHSAVLIGVIDETDSLEQGEVYVQIKKENNFGRNEATLFSLECNIMVTKNPCLHPGDIKILKAVNKDKILSHMVNVIVFSSKGKRPIQNEISGGDLDGDSFFVSWNENIINNIKKRNVTSLEETKGAYQSMKCKDIRMKDIVNSYIDYMKNDTIAIISNAHLAFADSDLKEKAFNEKCLKLSQLFCIAIDAPKHGNFVKQDEFKKNDLILKQFPDFLENPSFSQYPSPGILGQLYRLVSVKEYLNQFEYNEYKFNYCEDYLLDLNFVSENSFKYALKAYEIYKRFQTEIKILMKSAKVLNETEFFLCENISDKRNSKHYKQNDMFAELNILKDRYKNLIMNSFSWEGNQDNLSIDVASAIYIVTYINTKSVLKYYDLFFPKFRDLIKLMVNDNRISSEILSDTKYESNLKYFNDFKQYKNSRDRNIDYNCFKEIIDQKRIFSLPWLIKEVREKLFLINNNFN